MEHLPYKQEFSVCKIQKIFISFGGKEMKAISSKNILIAFLCLAFFAIFLVTVISVFRPQTDAAAVVQP